MFKKKSINRSSSRDDRDARIIGKDIKIVVIEECIYVYGASQVAQSKESACNAGDTGDVGSIPGLGRSPGGKQHNLLQYSCPENPMSRGAWQVNRVAKSWTESPFCTVEVGMAL